MLCFQLFYAAILLFFISGIDSRLSTIGFVLQGNLCVICEANGTKKIKENKIKSLITSQS